MKTALTVGAPFNRLASLRKKIAPTVLMAMKVYVGKYQMEVAAMILSLIVKAKLCHGYHKDFTLKDRIL
jgi:hypothetical protein